MPTARASSGVSSCQVLRKAFEPRTVTPIENRNSTPKPAAYFATSQPMTADAAENAARNTPKSARGATGLARSASATRATLDQVGTVSAADETARPAPRKNAAVTVATRARAMAIAQVSSRRCQGTVIGAGVL